MGRDIGDMGGLLDSSRAGIVYLSRDVLQHPGGAAG